MRESTVQVTRERIVAATPERAWSLLDDSAAWSLRPGSFAFDVPEPLLPETGPLRCFLAPGFLARAGEDMTWGVLEVWKEVPGRLITVQTRSSRPVGRQIFTLSVLPVDRGSIIRVSVWHTVPRSQQSDTRAYWRQQIRAWADGLKDVLEGRLPWPEPGIPPTLRRACAAHPLLKSPETVTAAVIVHAPLDLVWEAVYEPGSIAGLDNPDGFIFGGRIPGTPERQAGEMQYSIRRHADGRLTARALQVRELAHRRSALVQDTCTTWWEGHHQVTPVDGGIRLELTTRWPATAPRATGRQLHSRLAENVQRTADQYKAAIEWAARAPAGRHGRPQRGVNGAGARSPA
jgi:Polyketide cyclase / dehydrase and lipid transport